MFQFVIVFLLLILCFPSSLLCEIPGNLVRKTGYQNQDYARLSGKMEVVPQTVIVKFKPTPRGTLSKNSVGIASLSPVFLEYGVYKTIQMYPDRGNAFAPDGSDIGIERMYRLSYSSNTDPFIVAQSLSELYDIEYAEPERIHRLVYVPNDAMLSSQYALDVMNVKTAWDITTGRKEIVIAIVDSGVHWTHEDLRLNSWINPGEDINHDGKYTIVDLNGIDDDGNGYIDDIIGIDFAGADGQGGGEYYDNDPLPTATGNDHGTHVAGIIAAIGNNGKGIAGVAFNCRYMSIKCGTDIGGDKILRGYDGIIYAAENGAQIINCSWGGEGGYLQSEEDRINYAISKGAVVVAAAGNNGQDLIFTPAAYPNVLSVTSTNGDDGISLFSNFGSWVDVTAPGNGILSTISKSNDSYASYSGTSMACPQVAGILALVASHRPDLSPMQIAEQVRVTGNPIDSLQLSRYRRKIGYGRVNAYRALTKTSPSVRLISWEIRDDRTGNGNGILDRGETFEVSMRWKNFLQPTKNALISLLCTNKHVTITNPEFSVGVLGTNEETSNESTPFIIHLADVEALNEKIDLVFTITDEDYSDFGGIFFFQQPTYRDHNANDIVVTISNDGNIGFDDFSGLRGSGFIFRNNGYNVLFEGALMIGGKVEGALRVVDVARNESGYLQCTDFIGQTPVLMSSPGMIADQEGNTQFTDSNALETNRLGIYVNLHSYEFTYPDLRNLLILKYSIKNTSQNTIESLHTGLFFDWDISANANNDFALFDTTMLTGICFDRSGKVPTMVGISVLSRERPIHYMSINNPDNDSNPPIFGIHNGYTKLEKYRSISSGILQNMSKITDVSQVIGSGPYVLQPDESITIGFALIAGYSKEEILNTVPKALQKWDLITASTGIEPDLSLPGEIALQYYPHPAMLSVHQHISIQYVLQSQSYVHLELMDFMGRRIHTIVDQSQEPGIYNTKLCVRDLPTGTYILRMITENAITCKSLLIFR